MLRLNMKMLEICFSHQLMVNATFKHENQLEICFSHQLMVNATFKHENAKDMFHSPADG